MKYIRVAVSEEVSCILECLGYTYLYEQDELYMYTGTPEVIELIHTIILEDGNDEQ